VTVSEIDGQHVLTPPARDGIIVARFQVHRPADTASRAGSGSRAPGVTASVFTIGVDIRFRSRPGKAFLQDQVEERFDFTVGTTSSTRKTTGRLSTKR
jgi:hypothetical protein